MPLGRDYATQACSLARSLEIVGERWTLLILRDLFMGIHRFSDLHAHLDIPRAVLAARLAALVEQGIANAAPTARIGPSSTSRPPVASCGRSCTA